MLACGDRLCPRPRSVGYRRRDAMALEMYHSNGWDTDHKGDSWILDPRDLLSND